MAKNVQQFLALDIDDQKSSVSDASSTTFTKNMGLPVHRWFRYSAGFSADWVEETLKRKKPRFVLDPFAGSATTLITAETTGVASVGIDSHPFVSRVAFAKLAWRSSVADYVSICKKIRAKARKLSKEPMSDEFPPLIYKCYTDESLLELNSIRLAYEELKDDSDASKLAWLTLISILRKTSTAGTAQWQYVLPKKQKSKTKGVFDAFDSCVEMIRSDMLIGQEIVGPLAKFHVTDARTCEGVEDNSVDLVITSPPYPNNYDYADAVRLEMSFMKDISGWGDLQNSIRKHLIRSCTQHVPEKAVNLEEVLATPELAPIVDELRAVCYELAEVRKTKGGKKTYHLMVACYFRDLALVWHALRRVCQAKAEVCFVIGDSAPYGVYVPVIPWLGNLAKSAGFKSFRFERTRDRNTKWKNRKHTVPLQEGRLWVNG